MSDRISPVTVGFDDQFRGGDREPQSRRVIDGILIYGQSNAGVGGLVNTTLAESLFPHTSITFDQLLFHDAPAPDVTRFTALQSHQLLPLFVAVPAAFALQQYCIDAGMPDVRRFWHTTSVGSSPIAAFEKGQSAYVNLLTAARRFAELAAADGSVGTVRGVIWLQGETFSLGYDKALIDLIRDLRHDVSSQTQQATPPLVIVAQTNNHSCYSGYNSIAIDQLGVTRTAEGAVMAGPMYFTPHDNSHIHGSEIGRMMHGEVIALCCKSLFIDQTGWNPLWPRVVVRNGATIRIEFELPPDGKALAWDNDWIPLLPGDHFGFTYSDDNGSASIKSIALGLDGKTVIVNLNREPTGSNKAISYAMGQSTIMSPVAFPAARGALMSPTRQRSLFYRRGYRVPKYVRHYCVRFCQLVN